MNFRAKRLLPILSAVLLFTFALAADPLGTIEATYTGVNPSANASWSLNSGSSFSGTVAGVYTFNQVGGTFPTDILPAESSTIWAFCIELAQNISAGTYVFDVEELENGRTPGAPLGADRAQLLRSLFAVAFPPAGVFPTIGNSTFAAAMQLAVWEIAHETLSFTNGALNALNVSTGVARFTASSGIITEANSLLGLTVANFNLGTDGVYASNMFAMNSATKQDFVFQVVPGGGEQPIPEPTTMALIGLGLVGLALARRKQAAKA
jgi:hypothetical protein